MAKFKIKYEDGEVVFEARNKDMATDIAFDKYSSESIHGGLLYQVFGEKEDFICALS